MRGLEVKRLWVVLTVLFTLSGCVSVPLSLKPQDCSQTRRVGIFTTLVDMTPRALDHTGPSYTRDAAAGAAAGAVAGASAGGNVARGAAAGAAAGLVIGLIEVIDAAVVTRRSLGGSMDEVTKELGPFSMKQIFDQKLVERFSKTYEVVGPQVFSEESLKVEKPNDKLDALFTVAWNHGVDTLILVDFAYGMAVYRDTKASPAIDTVVKVYDIKTGNLLLMKGIRSDGYFRTARTVGELKPNKAELFRKEITEAADVAALAIASEFGIDKEMLPRPAVSYETMRLSFVTCSNPYTLDQDCSSLTGGTRPIQLKNYHMKIAGSYSGKYVLITGNCHTDEKPDLNKMSDSYLDPDGTVEKSHDSTACLDAVKELLAANGVGIVKTIGLADGGMVVGYLLELDGDGYSILKKQTANQ